MRIKINEEIIARLVKARLALQLTQMELHLKSNVGLRTIKDIESGRRTSYNESTLTLLCRALNLDYEELFGKQTLEGIKGRKLKRKATWGFFIVVVFSLLVIKGIFQPSVSDISNARTDWVNPAQKLQVSHFNPKWGEKENGININRFTFDRNVKPGDSVPVELMWSYHFWSGQSPSTPLYFINAFTSWEPDRSIDLFEGVLQGENSDTLHFEFISPERIGEYVIRVFFSSSFGPMSSYYGYPPPNQLSQPNSAPFIEIPIVVIAN
ncbi:helix-turn-helix transcriptional regulator [bacterium]|nr:helix-turn-helix transcriptional regulator [bacterium]